MVTVYQSTLNLVSPGAVSAGLKDGEKLSLRDLLYCVMVSSANDAAAVIAAHIGGNQAAFVEKMNRKAQELGCTASNFTNAHGLNDPNQYSTARDLALITEAALENETFVEMFCAKSYIVPATNKSPERKLRTTNYMISDDYIQGELDQRVTGGKPAAATNVDRSMICTAEVGAKRYLCVVMNVKGQVSQDGLSVIRFGIFQEMKTLLNFGFQNMQVVQLVDDGQTMYQYPVSGGDNDVFLRPSRDISVVLPQEYDPDLLRYEHILDAGVLSGPITNGQHMGSLQIRYGNILLGNCDLLSMNPVKPEGEGIRPADRIDVVEETKDSGYNRWLILGALVAGAVAVVVFVIWLIIRLVRTADIRRMQRKRARKRQRSKKS
jgi:D-alanyl-D-alanine carboxypeptidase (penicillin-binding protein 5/6)